MAGLARSAVALEQVYLSPDITVNLQSQFVDDDDVASDDLAGTILLAGLGTLPAASAIGAYHALGGERHLLVFESTTNLAGGVVARPRDVVRYDGADYVIVLDGEALGIPANARIDALSLTDGGAYLLSFDITVALDGVMANDEDLIEYDAEADAWNLAFDGSVRHAGLAAADLDAVHAVALLDEIIFVDGFE